MRPVLGCSGGMDSMVLAFVLDALGLHPVLVYIDHGLRPESKAEWAMVERWAKERGLDFRGFALDPDSLKKAAAGVQAEARNQRYRWLKSVADSTENGVVTTAHHADDRLEGFFISMVRGERWESLSGMEPWNGKVFRPLLGCSREEIYAVAVAEHIPWMEDASNASDRYLRNRIRRELTPFVKRENPSWQTALDELQSQLRRRVEREMAEAERWAEQAVQTSVLPAHGPIYRIDDQGMDEAQSVERAHFVRWLRQMGVHSGWTETSLFSASLGAEWHSGNWRLYRERGAFELTEAPVERASIWLGEHLHSIRWPLPLDWGATDRLERAPEVAVFDRSQLSFPLELRQPCAGDRLFPVGMKGSKLLSDLFQESGWSRARRHAAWILCCQGEVLWWIGQRIDRRRAAADDCSDLWQMRLRASSDL